MKEPESDDPMELRATECDGAPDFMIECVVEEYLRMGWPPEQVLRLFESPLYPPLYHLWRSQGAAAIRGRIERVAARCGVFRFRTLQAPAKPELVCITPRREGGCHDE